LSLADLSPTRQEVHVLHDYPSDFYGKELRVVVLGYVRPEYNYASMGA
jgi:riboflavin kinase